MRVLDEQTGLIGQLLGKQNIKDNTTYRPLRYVWKEEVSEGALLFNMFTGELLLLNNDEVENFSVHKEIKNETIKILIEKWFLVPDDLDDAKFSQQFIDLVTNVNRIYLAPKINDFTILPTTDCNARCFYCYELGCEKKTMSEQTAYDVVDYILKKKDDGQIKLRWFGGEPLYNSKAIDIICSELKKHGVDYRSHMISNAYLFDKEMIERAQKLWNLEKIQITIDGTEEIYNRTKAYIYKEEMSAFKRVIGNVEALLGIGVNVSIRLNMDKHNVDDLFYLSDFLIDKFKKYSNFFVYPHLLYENSCKFKKNDADEYDEYLNQKFVKLRERFSAAIKKRNKFSRVIRHKNHCMADSDNAIMILPDGKIGKCEHYIDSHFVGNIYDDIVDFKTLNWFKSMSTIGTKCDDCSLRPICYYVSCCPAKTKKCTPADKRTKEFLLKEHVLHVYKCVGDNQNET